MDWFCWPFLFSGCALFHSFWLGLLPMLALLLSLSEYIFPIRYTLTAQSASARCGLSVLEIRWADVRHAYLTDDGIKLSPLSAKNSRFESLRGVFLRFGDGNQEAIMAAVRSFQGESRFMSNAFGLIDFDWGAPLSEDERDAMLG